MSKAFDTVTAGDQIISAVRAALNASGRPDIALEREWLTITPGAEDYLQAVLMVPIGRNLTLPLKSLSRDEAPEVVLQRFAEDLFKALPNIEKARRSLRRYAADTRRAAEVAIASVREDGMDVSLAGIGLRETYAYHMTQKSWKEAADHVLATVLVNGMDYHLKPEVIEVVCEQPEDVADELAAALEWQKKFQEKRDALVRQGASVAVDVVTLRILFEHDLGFETISEVVRVGHKNIDVTTADGAKKHLYIVSSEGVVQSCISSDAGGALRWNLDNLEVPTDPSWGSADEYVGRDLAELTGDAFYEGLKVTSMRECGIGWTALNTDVPTRLFNAETGQFLQKAA